MVNTLIVGSGDVLCLIEGLFFPEKARFRAFAELKGDDTHRRFRAVAYQQQAFGFQPRFRAPGNQLRKAFRTVDQKKVAAVF